MADKEVKIYYDEYRNGYYNPDDVTGSSVKPGKNANWKAIQRGFAQSEKETDLNTDRIEEAENKDKQRGFVFPDSGLGETIDQKVEEGGLTDFIYLYKVGNFLYPVGMTVDAENKSAAGEVLIYDPDTGYTNRHRVALDYDVAPGEAAVVSATITMIADIGHLDDNIDAIHTDIRKRPIIPVSARQVGDNLVYQPITLTRAEADWIYTNHIAPVVYLYDTDAVTMAHTGQVRLEYNTDHYNIIAIFIVYIYNNCSIYGFKATEDATTHVWTMETIPEVIFDPSSDFVKNVSSSNVDFVNEIKTSKSSQTNFVDSILKIGNASGSTDNFTLESRIRKNDSNTAAPLLSISGIFEYDDANEIFGIAYQSGKRTPELDEIDFRIQQRHGSDSVRNLSMPLFNPVVANTTLLSVSVATGQPGTAVLSNVITGKIPGMTYFVAFNGQLTEDGGNRTALIFFSGMATADANGAITIIANVLDNNTAGDVYTAGTVNPVPVLVLKVG